MKILKLILENFSSIKVGMNINKLELDFTKNKNKICLLTGPNGCGKTSVISMLQPFSDIGNLDVRSSNGLIIKDKTGYKEIVIRNNDKLYTIKHLYTPHKDKNHSVKSYIMKDDVELNPNGNVTSFKEIIKTELFIEPDYLKLIRLGSNVTSLIGMTPTERKTFMTKLMDDIGVFLEYYKSVNAKLRQLDGMLSMTTNKLNKLGVSDVKKLKKEIKQSEHELNILTAESKKINGELEVCKSKISELGDMKSNREKYNEVYNEFKKINKKIEKNGKFKELAYYKNELVLLNDKKANIKNELDKINVLITSSVSQIDMLESTIHEYRVQIEKSNKVDDEINRMKDVLSSLNKKKSESEMFLKDFDSHVSKNDIESLILFLKSSQDMISSLYEIGHEQVKTVTKLMIKNKNVDDYIEAKCEELKDTDIKIPDNIRETILNIRKSYEKSPSTETCNDCSFKTLYNQLNSIIDVKDKNKDLFFYKDMSSIYAGLKSILCGFDEYHKIIELLPTKIRNSLDYYVVLKRIHDFDNIYDRVEFNNLLSLITEYDNYLSVCKKITDISERLSRLDTGNSTANTETALYKMLDKVNGLRDDVAKLRTKKTLLDDELDMTITKIYDVEDNIHIVEKRGEITEKYEHYKNIIEKHDLLYNNMHVIDGRLVKAEKDIALHNTILNDKTKKYNEYIVYQKDIEIMKRHYDKMIIIRDALSSKQGIPIQFIGNYLRNIEALTNDLLNIVYDGKISIDNFELSSTNFSIPYFNNGVRIPDVKYASQGELSFLSIALSFALSNQSLKHYNIMLLDEIDGPLDVDNRWKFIKILEKQIESINCEQCFLITHNNNFENYPVDVLDLNSYGCSED